MKYKISAVSYINTLPFVEGLNSEILKDYIEVSYDMPSICAEKVINGAVDIGLIPVAAIKDIGTANIISDYCIGAVDKVHTVCLFSEVPLAEIETIILDYQSRSSVQLVRILAKHYWNIDVVFEEGSVGYEELICGTRAGLIIGDRVFEMESNFSFQYDLAEAWMNWKKIPFCFAAWVSNKDIDPAFIQIFNRALGDALDKIDIAIEKYQPAFPAIDLNDYYKNKISYKLTPQRRTSVNVFLNYLEENIAKGNSIEEVVS